jgi:hypothetical protein
MATTSAELVVGLAPPPFSLRDVVSGRVVSLEEVRTGRALLVMFLCRHCPYVKHVEAEVARLARDYAQKLGIVGISASHGACRARGLKTNDFPRRKCDWFAPPILEGNLNRHRANDYRRE